QRANTPVYASPMTSRSSMQDSEPGWSRFSFPVGLSHPLQYAGLSRRSLTPFLLKRKGGKKCEKPSIRLSPLHPLLPHVARISSAYLGAPDRIVMDSSEKAPRPNCGYSRYLRVSRR